MSSPHARTAYLPTSVEPRARHMLSGRASSPSSYAPQPPRISVTTNVDARCPYGFASQIGWESNCRNCFRGREDHSVDVRIQQSNL